MKPLQDLAGRWPEIDALLEEALALPAAERGPWLAQLSGERASLRGTLVELLAAHADAEHADFLGTLAALPVPDETAADDEPQPGAMVGPYRLLSVLGHGGMGTVWLAERADGQLKREVALKLPRLAWGSAVGERLARERDILATLAHPNIARLYDAGVDARGRPYLALERVEGEPIDAYARRAALPLRERLGLLLQVAAAVAHAHARLVVHRDLKPGNILVTPDGQVRLLDFGIAKLVAADSERTQETALTRLAGAALTPDYASPEQIRGEPLSTGSDVYSLAVVAFELLAGTRPYRLKRGSAAELEEAIASAEPPLASTAATDAALRRALRGDLDAILNRALKKSPAERYPSIEAFAADLQRHLRGEPVQARPDGRGYRLRRFVARHRLPVGLSAALGASVLAGAAIAGWQALQARAESQRALAEVARQEAVRDLYLEAVTQMSTAMASDPASLAAPHAVARLLEARMRAMAPRYKQRPNEWQGLLEAVMLQLNYSSDFERSLAVGQEYLAVLKRDGASPARVIDAHAVLGRTLFQLRRLDESEAMRRAGLQWAPAARDERTELSRLGISTDLGNVLTRRGERAAARAVLEQAEARAAQAFPAHPLRHMNLLVLAALDLNFDPARALQLARKGQAGVAAAGNASSDEEAEALQTLGVVLLGNGAAAEAEAVMRQAEARLGALYPRDNRNRVRALGRVASALARQGRYGEARALLDAEQAALVGASGGDAATARLILQGRQLENAYLEGDLAAALTYVSADPLALVKAPSLRDNDLTLALECRTLVASGRAAQALARTAAVAQAWPERGKPGGPWLRIAEALALAQLAAGEAPAARSTAHEQRELLLREGGQRGWPFVVATEIEALAAAQAGEPGQALQDVAALAAVPAPSPVDRAESALRRAQLFQLTGRPAQAAAAARAALPDLAGQHADSPRLRDARLLAALAPG